MEEKNFARPSLLGCHFAATENSSACQDRLETNVEDQGLRQARLRFLCFSFLAGGHGVDRHRQRTTGKKTSSSVHFLTRRMNLPRQARDKHSESTQKRVPFSCRESSLRSCPCASRSAVASTSAPKVSTRLRSTASRYANEHVGMFLSVLMLKCYHFAKTGSGQT